MTNQIQKRLIDLVTFLLIFLFVYTASSKLLALYHFKVIMSRAPIIGQWSSWLSWSIPITELAVAACLAIPRMRGWGFLGSVILMAAFTAYIAIMITFFDDLPCACGGVISKLNWKQHLWFNIAFLVLALTALSFRNKDFIAINRSSRIPV